MQPEEEETTRASVTSACISIDTLVDWSACVRST